MSKTQRYVHAEAGRLIASPFLPIINLERAIREIRCNMTHWSDTDSAMHRRISARGRLWEFECSRGVVLATLR
jgi:hypothetical protein